MAWQKLGTNLLTTSGNTCDVTVTEKNFHQVMGHYLDNGTIDPDRTYNADTGTNYALRFSKNGASDTTAASADGIRLEFGTDNSDVFEITNMVNLATDEKLCVGGVIRQQTAGAGTAPERYEWIWKWDNTSNQITAVETDKGGGAGNFNTDTNVTVLGTD